jgi:excisionase family DNA binding protein
MMGERKLDDETPIYIEDIIRMSGASERKIREDIKTGKLKAYKPGKRLQFKMEDYEKWFSRTRVN